MPEPVAFDSGKRSVWLGVGLAATGCGFVGVFLPLVPTTPFLLIAAYAFARSSPRLRQWLVSHRTFGRLIRNWQQNRAIDRRSKILAVLVMLATLAASWLIGIAPWIVALQAVVLAAAASFILTRPDGQGIPN